MTPVPPVVVEGPHLACDRAVHVVQTLLASFMSEWDAESVPALLLLPGVGVAGRRVNSTIASMAATSHSITVPLKVILMGRATDPASSVWQSSPKPPAATPAPAPETWEPTSVPEP